MSKKHNEIWSDDAKKLGYIFSKKGHDIRIVGGAVRDAIIGKIPHDIDLAIDATPQEMMLIAKEMNLKTFPTIEEVETNPDLWNKGGLKHGTVCFVENGEVMEVTSLRTDVNTDGRHADVEFVRDFKKDAERRDLTFNACSVDLNGTLHDYFNGENDLKNGRVKFVGNTEKRIQEDYLRILRYFRFKARFGKENVDNNEEIIAIKKNAEGLKQIAGERIWSEIYGLLNVPNGFLEFSDIKQTGLHHFINLPLNYDEKDQLYLETIMNKVQPHIFIATICALQNEEILPLKERWHLSNKEFQEMTLIIENFHHMKDAPYSDFVNLSLKLKKRFQSDNVLETTSQLLKVFKRFDEAEEIFNGLPIFPVKGVDLIKNGMKPGKEIGVLLSQMEKKWVDENYSPTKDELINDFLNNTENQNNKLM